MKKWIVIGLLFVSLDSICQSSIIQTMIKQIALLQTYIGYLEKGYDIARKGLNTIGDIKNGHWQMDITFFNSLKNVNPRIKNYSKVTVILGMQTDIVRRCRQLKRLPVNEDEVLYLGQVSEFLQEEMETLTQLLELVITDKEFTMSDDERMTVIDQLCDDVADKYNFICSFLSATKTLLLRRAKEKNDIRVIRELINPEP